jgi:two-component SAPR family response regulator
MAPKNRLLGRVWPVAPVDLDCPNIICFVHPISYVNSTIFVHIVFISSYKKKIKDTVETVSVGLEGM